VSPQPSEHPWTGFSAGTRQATARRHSSISAWTLWREIGVPSRTSSIGERIAPPAGTSTSTARLTTCLTPALAAGLDRCVHLHAAPRRHPPRLASLGTRRIRARRVGAHASSSGSARAAGNPAQCPSRPVPQVHERNLRCLQSRAIMLQRSLRGLSARLPGSSLEGLAPAVHASRWRTTRSD